VIGLQHNSEDMLGLSIFMAMDFCQSKIMEDRTKNKFFIIDESWKLLMNPIAANRLMASSKLLRAYSAALVIGSQSLSDVLAYEDGKYGLAVLNSCATKIFMTLKEKDAQVVQDMIDLSDSEVSNVTKFKAGQGLLLAGDTRVYLTMTPSETEKLLTFTDKETLEKYVAIKKKKEEKERLMELYENAEELDVLFDYSD
jgi:type IV secretory pathway VirB4 component